MTHSDPDNNPPQRSHSEADASLAMRLLRLVWQRRKQAARMVHATGHALGWLYDKFPLPRRVKDITTELTYHGIEHFIVQSESYQNWLHRRAGLTRLHGLFSREPIEIAPPIAAPSRQQWERVFELHHRKDEMPLADDAIAIIVPVYKGLDETMACLYSVLTARNSQPFTLTVINDASPDRELADRLLELQQHGLCDLIIHIRNEGFVRSVNEGMKRHTGRDILLLNADTEVYDGWLDRMAAALKRNPKAASVTPFSNNAELCSYPRSFHGNMNPLEISYATLDALCATANKGIAPELPTAVGFCMLLRATALEQVGYFDDNAFGRGYGEENDWCLRAAGLGWHHLLAADVFVRHVGSVSFEAYKRRELKRSLQILNARHPHYRELVRRFRDEDPLHDCRMRIDLERLRFLGGKRAFLMISHNAGGGTEKHIRDIAERLEADGISIYRLSPDAQHASRLRLWHHAMPDCPNLVFDLDDEQDPLIECLKSLNIMHLHLHHLLGFPQRMSDFIPLLARRLACAYDVTIHDYYFACPSINLVYGSGYFEGNPSIATSAAWAERHPTAAGRTPIWQWREQHQMLLQGARRVMVPSADCGQRIQHFFPLVDVFMRPHPDPQVATASLYQPRASGEPLHIAVIGKLTAHKGAAIILQMAQDAKARKLPLHLHIFGEAVQEAALKRTGHVTVHGAYEEGTIYGHLTAHRCHLALIPSIWPETYTYTLSIAFNAQIYPVCFDMGAPAERIRAAKWGTVLPADLLHQADALNDTLLATQTQPVDATTAQMFRDYPSMLRDYYSMQPDGVEIKEKAMLLSLV